MRISYLALLLSVLPLASQAPGTPPQTLPPSQPAPGSPQENPGDRKSEPTATPAAPSPGSMPPPIAKKPSIKLDKGLLDPEWFGNSFTFNKGDVLDFYWIKPGLSLKGRSIKVGDWDAPAWLGPKRDDRDRTTVETLMDSFPGILKRSLEKTTIAGAKFSRKEGEWLLIGRFVDCNAKSVAAKAFTPYFAGTENITWDMKIVDPRSNEILLAVHHRIISGAFSTIERKLAKWTDEFALFLAEKASNN